MSAHHCHAPGCGASVPPKMFACRRHWFALPRAIQLAIWAEYRNGQERDKQPSLRYMAVQTAARAVLAFKPRDEAAALLSAELVLQAFHYVVTKWLQEQGANCVG